MYKRQVIELIRDQRIRNGTWTLNKARSDIGEPPVDGGDNPLLVDRQNMVLWSDLEQLSAANLAVVKAQGSPVNMPQPPNTNPGAPAGAGAKTPKSAVSPSSAKPKTSQTPTTIDAPKAPSGTEAYLQEDDENGE